MSNSIFTVVRQIVMTGIGRNQIRHQASRGLEGVVGSSVLVLVYERLAARAYRCGKEAVHSVPQSQAAMLVGAPHVDASRDGHCCIVIEPCCYGGDPACTSKITSLVLLEQITS